MRVSSALGCLAAVAVLLGRPCPAVAAEFTYQGKLEFLNEPVSGLYHMLFRLYDAASSGSQVGPEIELLGVPVIDGLFTVNLDFGDDVFAGGNRWLEIYVKQDIPQTYQKLMPRQKLTTTPIAHYALQAGGSIWKEIQTRAGAAAYYTGSFVGIGTDDPKFSLHIAEHDNLVPSILLESSAGRRLYLEANTFSTLLQSSGGAPLVIEVGGPAMTIDTSRLVGIGTTTPNARLTVRSDTADDIFNVYNGTAQAFTIRSGGNVGIGVPAPTARLHVDGQGRFNSGIVPGNAPNAVSIFNDTIAAPLNLNLNVAANASLTSNSVSIDSSIVTVDASFTTLKGLQTLGIATNAVGFNLAVAGTAAKTNGGSWAVLSDARRKKDIEDLDGALDQLLALRGVTFEYKPGTPLTTPGRHIGMIAQEVREVFPEWVDELETGDLAVTYRGFEALTVEALRELREEKDVEIAALQQQVDELKQLVAQLLEEREAANGEAAQRRSTEQSRLR